MMYSPANLNIATAFQMGFAFRLGYEYALHPELGKLSTIKARQITNDAAFEENKHPRDKDGKFSKSKTSGTIKEIYGHEITGLKLTGQKAVNAVLKRRGGHVKAAFYRPEIGDIDVIWGDKKSGLRHIIESRLKNNQSPTEVLNNLNNVIKHGQIVKENEPFRNETTYRLELWNKGKGYRVIITKTVRNAEPRNKIHYVLTDMEIRTGIKWHVAKKN